MCGIVFGDIKNGKRACKVVMKRYRKQSVRGKEGYGAVAVDNGKVKKIYRSENESGMSSLYNEQSQTILFHHRRPTSTPNFVECTHPISVVNKTLEYNYLVVHNGVISNAEALRTEFEKLGFEYTTAIQELYRSRYTGEERMTGKEKFNDSESLAIDLALAIEQGKTKTQAYGSIAFVAIQYNKINNEVNKVYFGRNAQSPLKIDKHNGNFILASEGAGEDVETHKLYSYDIATGLYKIERDFDVGYNYNNIGTYYNNKTKTDVQEIREITLFPRKETVTDESLKSVTVFASVKLFNDDGSFYHIEVPTIGGCLAKTSVRCEDFDIVTKIEWEEYLNTVKKIESLKTWEKDMKDWGIEYTESDIKDMTQQQIDLYLKLGSISKAVHARKKLLERV